MAVTFCTQNARAHTHTHTHICTHSHAHHTYICTWRQRDKERQRMRQTDTDRQTHQNWYLVIQDIHAFWMWDFCILQNSTSLHPMPFHNSSKAPHPQTDIRHVLPRNDKTLIYTNDTCCWFQRCGTRCSCGRWSPRFWSTSWQQPSRSDVWESTSTVASCH